LAQKGGMIFNEKVIFSAFHSWIVQKNPYKISSEIKGNGTSFEV